MCKARKRGLSILYLVVGLVVWMTSLGFAQEKAGITGWERGGAYDAHYKTSEFDSFKGVVEDISDIIPMPGMAPGVGLKVRDQDGDVVNVQVGPKSFVNLESISLKKGDKVKVKGAWAEIDDKDIFMASKIKKGEYIEFKVRRTKDGMPYWTMTPEELAKEKEQE
jgi:hypothetical protein